jgi:hypothetical protein
MGCDKCETKDVVLITSDPLIVPGTLIDLYLDHNICYIQLLLGTCIVIYMRSSNLPICCRLSSYT